jgi:hypothetical protein
VESPPCLWDSPPLDGECPKRARLENVMGPTVRMTNPVCASRGATAAMPLGSHRRRPSKSGNRRHRCAFGSRNRRREPVVPPDQGATIFASLDRRAAAVAPSNWLPAAPLDFGSAVGRATDGHRRLALSWNCCHCTRLGGRPSLVHRGGGVKK